MHGAVWITKTDPSDFPHDPKIYDWYLDEDDIYGDYPTCIWKALYEYCLCNENYLIRLIQSDSSARNFIANLSEGWYVMAEKSDHGHTDRNCKNLTEIVLMARSMRSHAACMEALAEFRQ